MYIAHELDFPYSLAHMPFRSLFDTEIITVPSLPVPFTSSRPTEDSCLKSFPLARWSTVSESSSGPEVQGQISIITSSSRSTLTIRLKTTTNHNTHIDVNHMFCTMSVSVTSVHDVDVIPFIMIAVPASHPHIRRRAQAATDRFHSLLHCEFGQNTTVSSTARH
jgi:hypothetical protein